MLKNNHRNAFSVKRCFLYIYISMNAYTVVCKYDSFFAQTHLCNDLTNCCLVNKSLIKLDMNTKTCNDQFKTFCLVAFKQIQIINTYHNHNSIYALIFETKSNSSFVI